METQLPSFQQAPVPGQHVAGGATCVSIPTARVKYFSPQITPLRAIHTGVWIFCALCNKYIVDTQQI